MTDTLLWALLLFCVTQSGCLSGLNLAVFSMSRLRLEVAAENGDRDAQRVLDLRRDANFTLVTILWGNVAVNVLIAMLAESVMVGVVAFLFSTIVITFFGEIIPQAWFSRNALKVVRFLAPLLRFYQFLLWPVARPVGRLLDWLVGPEPIPWYREDEMRDMLQAHGRAGEDSTDVGRIEAIGAHNFLKLDDLPVWEEGEPLDPDTIIPLPFENGRPVFPEITQSSQNPFLKKLAMPQKKWCVIVDAEGQPRRVLNSHEFLRQALFSNGDFDPMSLCHRPILVTDSMERIGNVLDRLRVEPEYPGDDVIDVDLILVWDDEQKRVITGSDLLGRLFRRISKLQG